MSVYNVGVLRLRNTVRFANGIAALRMTRTMSIPAASAAPRLAPKERARTWGTADKKSQTLRMTNCLLSVPEVSRRVKNRAARRPGATESREPLARSGTLLLRLD